MPAPSKLPAPGYFPPDLLTDVLAVSLTAINLLRPLYDASGTLEDFAVDYLNPAAQRMTGLAEWPGGTMRERFPDTLANGIFALYKRVYETGEAGRHDFYYQADGFDNYFQVAARRSGERLVVSFTDTADQPRTAAEEALRDSQAREQQALAEAEREKENMLRMFEQATVAMSLFQGPDYVIELANVEMANIWGRPLAHTLGRPVFEALPEIAGQGFEAIFAEVLQHGTSYDLQAVPVTIARAHTARPTLGYFNLTYRPQCDAQGHITGIVTLAIEVTAQVLAQQQVEAQARHTHQLNQELQAANAEIQATNATLLRIQGQLRAFNQELEVRVAERTQHLRESQAREQAARQAAEAQQQQLRNIFEQAPVAICLMRGPQAVVELLNEQGAALVGRTPAQVIGRPIREAMPVLNGQGFEALLPRVLQGETLVFQEMPITFDRTHTDQPALGYFHHTYQPWRDETGAIVGMINIGVEVTEQVLARRQVQQLNQELLDVNEALLGTNHQLMRTNVDLDNFIYSASHDLKAPISNIEGLLRLLEDLLPAELRTDDTLLPVLTRMQESVERFTRTIGHLTEVSKLQLEFAHSAAPTSLAPLLHDVRQDLAPLFTETGGQLVVDVAACPTLLFSEKNLRSLLYNLVSNALKYHCPGRPPVVRLSCRIEANRRVLRVQDNGLGLSEGQQAKLFQLFSRLHAHVEGTGVGLYMAKKMVENAQGTLTVESREGEGTTFTASFPA